MACGDNTVGQLGFGDVLTRSQLAQVSTLNTWQSVSSGKTGMFAIKTDGSLWGVGANQYSQLGIGGIVSYSSPVQIGSLTNWKQVSTGWIFTAAISNGSDF